LTASPPLTTTWRVTGPAGADAGAVARGLSGAVVATRYFFYPAGAISVDHVTVRTR
jgi:hypothetical protein